MSSRGKLVLVLSLAWIGAFVLGVRDAGAFETFEDGCVSCHTGFDGGPSSALHSEHLPLLNSDCFRCHVQSPGDNPNIGLNQAGDKGCVGCHGRAEDAGHDQVFGQPAPGLGAGLRQHHTNEGISACAGCHFDATAANYTPVGENVFPPFYATFSLDPASDTLDNDGDLLVDLADPDFSVNEPPVADPNGPYTGEVGVAVVFDGSASLDLDGTIVAYDWDFGDGATGTGVSPTHTYATPGTFTVTLTVTDDGGATDTASTTADIAAANQPPVADAGGPYFGAPGQPVQLDGSASFDPDGTIFAYLWDFGDGGIGMGATPTHTYAAEGTYTATLTVADDDGAMSSAEATVTITANQPPLADPGGPYSGTAGQAVALDGSASIDPDGTIVAYDWDFGDGATGTGATPSHTYTTQGTYTVTLTVTDDAGATDSATTTVEITEAGGGGGNTWLVQVPYLQSSFTLTIDPFGHILLVHEDFPDGTSLFGVGMQAGGVIFWFDVQGALFYGIVDQPPGTMQGIVFNFLGGNSIWFAEQQP